MRIKENTVYVFDLLSNIHLFWMNSVDGQWENPFNWLSAQERRKERVGPNQP